MEHMDFCDKRPVHHDNQRDRAPEELGIVAFVVAESTSLAMMLTSRQVSYDLNGLQRRWQRLWLLIR